MPHFGMSTTSFQVFFSFPHLRQDFCSWRYIRLFFGAPLAASRRAGKRSTSRLSCFSTSSGHLVDAKLVLGGHSPPRILKGDAFQFPALHLPWTLNFSIESFEDTPSKSRNPPKFRISKQQLIDPEKSLLMESLQDAVLSWLGVNAYLLPPLVLACWMACGDARTRRIPNYLTLATALAGLGFN
jgi:hypothetical protein